MLRTEDEAKACMCPFARCHPRDRLRPDNKCFAAQCAMWRDGGTQERVVASVYGSASGSPGIVAAAPRVEVRVGFCGLAGKPS